MKLIYYSKSSHLQEIMFIVKFIMLEECHIKTKRMKQKRT